MRPWTKVLAGGIGLVLVLLAWVHLAPRQLGGGVSYVVVARGTSMEPNFHAGDLAVVRPRDGYEVGDVVAYHSRDLRAVVLHRIADREGARYVLKGDSNGALDPERPTAEEIEGAVWVRIPAVGTGFTWLREPRNAGLVGGALTFLLVVAIGARRHRRKRQVRRRSVPLGSRGGQALAGLLAAVLAFGLLAGAAFAGAATFGSTEELPFRHRGAFTYSAEVSDTEVYEHGVVQAGDPVFLRLVTRLGVAFTYILDTEAPTDVSGTGRLYAEISNTNGWRRSVEIQEEIPFTGRVFEARGMLDLGALRKIVERLERATGVVRESYSVSIVADVQTRGTLAGADLVDSFIPRLDFHFDRLQLALAPPESHQDPLHPSAPSAVTHRVERPRTIGLLSLELPVPVARVVGVAGAAVAAIALLLTWVVLAARRRGDEPSRIRRSYGDLLIPVRAMEGETSLPVADVEGFEDLLRLADHADRMIMYADRGEVHSYLVEDGGVLVRYQVRKGTSGAGATSASSNGDARAAQTPEPPGDTDESAWAAFVGQR